MAEKFVYFIANAPPEILRAENNGFVFVKIGNAVNPKARLSHLQTSHYEKLYIIKTVKGGAALEKKIHEMFAHLRIRGELFRMESDLKAFINTMPNEGDSGEFDYSYTREEEILKQLKDPHTIHELAKITGYANGTVYIATQALQRRGLVKKINLPIRNQSGHGRSPSMFYSTSTSPDVIAKCIQQRQDNIAPTTAGKILEQLRVRPYTIRELSEITGCAFGTIHASVRELQLMRILNKGDKVRNPSGRGYSTMIYITGTDPNVLTKYVEQYPSRPHRHFRRHTKTKIDMIVEYVEQHTPPDDKDMFIAYKRRISEEIGCSKTLVEKVLRGDLRKVSSSRRMAVGGHGVKKTDLIKTYIKRYTPPEDKDMLIVYKGRITEKIGCSKTLVEKVLRGDLS